MIYIDTSVIVKLYVREQYSFEVSNWIKKNNKAIPLTRFHELEFTNAIELKSFRSEINERQKDWVHSAFDDHKKIGIYYYPVINWTETWDIAIDLSGIHTRLFGSRSLDILHVASAMTMKAQHFFSLDSRQAKLASAAGLSIVNL